MAKRERNKRSARKARQRERERIANAHAVTGYNQDAGSSKSKSLFKRSEKGGKASKKAAVAKADRKGMQKVTGYFADVRSEMRQVTWPSRIELRNYSVAVIASLVVFGVAIWLVDTGFIAALVQYTGLRG